MDGLKELVYRIIGTLMFVVSIEGLLKELAPTVSYPLVIKIVFFFIICGIFWAFWEFAEHMLKFLWENRGSWRKQGTQLTIEGRVFKVAFTKKDDLCAMCLEHLDQDRVVILPKCGHDFHVRCFLKWFTIRKTCATCMQQI